MSTLTLDLADGTVALDGTPLSGLALPAFTEVHARLGLQDTTRNPPWATFGGDVRFAGEPFGVSVDFDGPRQRAIWLLWEAGTAATKGHDCSEAELIADKKALSKRLSTFFLQAPAEVAYHRDHFVFPWGRVTVAAAIQSMMVSVSFERA